MRVSEKRLRAIVRSVIVEDSQTPQADKDDVLGQYAFANDRIDKKVPKEKDTAAEYQLYNQLDGHFNTNTPLNAKASSTIKGILDKDVYKNVFNEPDASAVLYRGFSVDEAWIRKHAGFEDWEEVPHEGTNIGHTMIKSHKDEHGSSSWSTDMELARTFSTPTTGKAFAVLVYAKASDNPHGFLMGDGGLYNVKTFTVFKHEEEAVALGPVKAYKFEWTSNYTGPQQEIPIDLHL